MSVKVSIVLPTCNRLEYLPPAVESVFSQTFTDWELIVADDGSGPQTREYLSTLRDHPRVKVIGLSHLGNPGAVRNAALREARGDYVAFLDSDDSWMPEKLQVQLAALRARPERQWSYTEFIHIDRAGKSIDERRNPNRVLHEGQIVEQLLSMKVGIALPTVMIVKQLLERTGGFDEQQELHEDTELWLRLALLSPVSAVTRPLAYIRCHDRNFGVGGIRALQARRKMLAKMQGLITDSRQRRVLHAERTRNEAALAFANAAAGNRRIMWQTLTGSWRFSWRSLAWYLGSARAVARSFAPPWLVPMVRRYRRR